ncbi:MAG: GAF domain-containing protein [Acidobacteriota bacterium]
MVSDDTDALSTILAALTAGLKPDDLFRRILVAAQELTGFPRIAICLVDRERKLEEAKYSLGSEDDGFRTQAWEIDGTINPWITDVIDAKRTVVIDPAADPAYAGSKLKTVYDGPFVKVPIVVRDVTVGSLTADDAGSRRPITAGDVAGLELIARCTAVAIDQTRASEEILRSHEEVIRAQRQLIEAEKLAALGAMAASINHEINNPLTAIVLDLQLMGLNLPADQETLRKRLVSIENSVNRIRAVVEKVAAVKRTIVTEYQPKTNMLDLNLSTRS